MINVGSFVVGSTNNGNKDFSNSSYSYEYPYCVEFLYRDGTFKRKVYIGSNDNPIISMKFKLNKQGPADGSIELAYIDWTIDRLDIVNVYYKGTKIYTGLIDTKPDLNGGEISIIPRRERLKDIVFRRKKYTGNIFAKDILCDDVFSTGASKHGIIYNRVKISHDFLQKDEVQLVQPSFEDSDYESIIQQLIDQIDSDATWGVDVNNLFFVSYPEEAVTIQLDETENPDYTEINVTTNYDNIKQTRAYVYRAGDTDNGEDEDVYCGTVCFEDSDYRPIQRLETEIGVIENIISIDTILVTINGTTATQRQQQIQQANDLALKYAYNQIKAQQINNTIELKNINLDKYIPQCNKKIKVTKCYNNQILWTLVDCETTTSWVALAPYLPYQPSLNDTHVMHGSYSVDMPQANLMYVNLQHNVSGIDFLEIYIWVDTEKNNFTITISEKILTFNLTLGWNRLYIDVKNLTFSSIYFGSGNFLCNEINAYSTHKQVYEGNITEVEYEIKNGNVACNAIIGNYDIALNDTLQYLEWKIKELDNVKKISSQENL